ncbi:MAG: hypothetical protein O3C65_13815 [Proteobacteria bacterium]|nr:hypothetical protein [Pseudomonadota bacterium]MDA1059755.1 hypothetical protein [Pseudomonadota bacterium]
MTETVFALTGAYIVVGLLLLSLNLASRWRWWIKVGAVVIVSALYLGTFVGIESLLGWPSPTTLPSRFQLLYGKVVEPNKFTSEVGYIYLWVEVLDENNVPSGLPRAYQVPYTDDLAHKVLTAIGRVEDGELVAGEVSEIDLNGRDEDDPDKENIELEEDQDEQGGGVDVELFPDNPFSVDFGDMPPPVLPEKDVI